MNFTKSLKTKSFKYGAFSAAGLAVAIAVLIAANLFMAQLSLTYDLTPEQLYSISDASKEILDDLAQDVTIYPMFLPGHNNTLPSFAADIVQGIINEYAAYSRHITVSHRDPVMDPTFAAQFAEGGKAVPTGSVIVESGGQSRVIEPQALVSLQLDAQLQWQLVSVDVEPQITNAILFVTQTETPVVYVVSGHEEMPLPQELIDEIVAANFEVRDLDMLREEAVPDDCALLLVQTPSFDWTADEADMAMAYLAQNGRAIFMLDMNEREMPNLRRVLAGYGISASNSFVVEGHPSWYVETPLFLLPSMPENDVTQIMSQRIRAVIMPNAQAIDEISPRKQSITIEPLLATSPDSYAKTTPDPQSPYFEPGDTPGPLVVGVAVTDRYYAAESYETKLIVLGSSLILDPGVNMLSGGGNYQFLINGMNWTQDQAGSRYIPPKRASTMPLQMTATDVLVRALFSTVVLPVALLAVGIAVWLKRRNS